MGLPPLVRSRGLIGRRPHQRMTEPDDGTELDQSLILRGRQCGRIEFQPLGRPADHRRVAGGFGSCDEKHPPCLGRKRLHAAKEALLDPARQLSSLRQSETARELRRSESSRQLQECQRVASSLGDDPVSDLLVETSRQDRVQEQPRIVRGKPFEHELRQPVELLRRVRFADGEQHADRLGGEAACNERQDRQGLGIEPLHVVDHADERLLVRDVREQAQRCQADEEVLRRRSVRQIEGAPQRVSLRRRQLLRALEHRARRRAAPGRRRQAPSPTPRRRRGRLGSPTTARRRSPAGRTCRRRAPRE